MKASVQERISSDLPTMSADLFLSCTVLFPDAKISKNITQNLICGDFADDAAEVVDGFADVLGG